MKLTYSGIEEMALLKRDDSRQAWSLSSIAIVLIFIGMLTAFILGVLTLYRAFDSQRLLREKSPPLTELQPWLAGQDLKVPFEPGLWLETVAAVDLLLVSARPDGVSQTLDFCFRAQPDTEGRQQIRPMILRAGLESHVPKGKLPAAQGRPVVLRAELAAGLPSFWVHGHLTEHDDQAEVVFGVDTVNPDTLGTWQVAFADSDTSTTDRMVKTYKFDREAWLLWNPQAHITQNKVASVALFSQAALYRWGIRLRRVAVTGCRWGGIEWQLFDASQRPLTGTTEYTLIVRSHDAQSPPAPTRSRLVAGTTYKVPVFRSDSLEDQNLFEKAQELGFIRSITDGRVWVAPPDFAKHQVLKELYQSDNGQYVLNQIKALNQDRHWVALRLKPWIGQNLPVVADPAHWHLASEGELLTWSAGLPAVATRLQNVLPVGYGDWTRVLAPAAWVSPMSPESRASQPSKVQVSMPVVVNSVTAALRFQVLILGGLQTVHGAIVIRNKPYCQGVGCDSDQLLRQIDLEIVPGAREVRLEISSEEGFNRFNPSAAEQRRVQWRSGQLTWVNVPEMQTRFNPADVTVLARDGQSLFTLGWPTKLALGIGLGQQVGLSASHGRSLAGNLARMGSYGYPQVTAVTTIETEYQRSLQSVLRCVGHQEGRWQSTRPVCSEERSDVPLNRISAAVLIDAHTGAILGSASGQQVPTGVSLVELLDFDAFNPVSSYLKMPVQHHTGGLTQTPGSTFKILDALMLEKLAVQSKSVDKLLEGQTADEWERWSREARLKFLMKSPCYPAPCGSQQNQVENHLSSPTSRYLEANRFGLVQAMQHSTNTWFALWAEMTDKTAGTNLVEARGLGEDALSQERPLTALIDDIGFDQAMPLDGGLLPSEMRLMPGDALLATASVLDPIIDTHNIRIQALGLRMQTTPLHMARVAAGVATGSLPQVHLLDEINGQVTRLRPSQPLNMYLGRVRRGMNEVIRAGTAAHTFEVLTLKGVRHLVYGKTGTAQQGEGQCSGLDRQDIWPPNCLNNAWFVGYMLPGVIPGERRTLAFAVQISHTRQTGGASAAAVMSAWLQDRLAAGSAVQNVVGQ